MNQRAVDRAVQMISELVALRSINPMGGAHDRDTAVERPVTDYIERLMSPHGLFMERQACSPIHENLLVTVPGRETGPCTLLESHADTVPADDWADRAFTPRVEGTRVYGRGACDDKASLAAMLLAVLEVLESGERPLRPVLLLASGDEEYAQTGIKHFMRTCETEIGRGIFGEPTEMVPVIQHKGTIRWDITVHGRSAHTSRPQLGRNAILEMVRVIEALDARQRDFQERFTSALMSGPTLTVTMIHGGRTRNAVPDECTIAVDLRVVPGMDCAATRDEVIQAVDGVGLEVTHSEPQVMAPSLATAPDDPFTQIVVDICASCLDRAIEPEGVPYGTDAAWLSGTAPAIVLGPGSIDTTHAVDEFVDAVDVVRCAEIYRRVVMHEWEAA